MVCYPFEIFLDTDVLSEIQCPVCDGIVKDGVSDKCGRSIGRECYMQLTDNEADCPSCKVTTSLSRITPLPSNLAKFISKLHVKCINTECQWNGRLEEYEMHLKSNCSFEEIKCLFDGCEIGGQRRTVVRHQIICPFKPVTCEMCNHKVTLQNLEAHQEALCPEMSIPCSMQCGQKVKRHQLEQHLSYVCPETMSECEFKQLGCAFTGKRKDTIEHALSNRGYSHHMLLLTNCFKNWQKEDESTFKRIEGRLSKIESCLLKNQNENEKLSDLMINLQTTIHKNNEHLKTWTTSSESSRLQNQLNLDQNQSATKQNDYIEIPSSSRKLDSLTVKSQPFNLESNMKFCDKLDARNLYIVDPSKLDQSATKGSTHQDMPIAPSLPKAVVQSELQTLSASGKEQAQFQATQSKVDPRFDDKASTETMKMISSKQVLNVKSKGIILMRDEITSGQIYKINCTNVKSNDYAIGLCLKSRLIARKYNIETSLDDCFMFVNNGNQIVDGMIKKAGQNQTALKFASGSMLELCFDASKKSLICKNTLTGVVGSIDLSELKSMEGLYPCIAMGEKMETANID